MDDVLERKGLHYSSLSTDTNLTKPSDRVIYLVYKLCLRWSQLLVFSSCLAEVSKSS